MLGGRGSGGLIAGIAMVVIGIGMTVVSYQLSPPGGTYFVAYGLIIAGFIRIVASIGTLSNRRRARPRGSAARPPVQGYRQGGPADYRAARYGPGGMPDYGRDPYAASGLRQYQPGYPPDPYAAGLPPDGYAHGYRAQGMGADRGAPAYQPGYIPGGAPDQLQDTRPVPLQVPPGVCWQCGQKVKPQHAICYTCGAAQVRRAAPEPEPSSSWEAALPRYTVGATRWNSSPNPGQDDDWGAVPPGYMPEPPQHAPTYRPGAPAPWHEPDPLEDDERADVGRRRRQGSRWSRRDTRERR
jgi:hypothetical protein